MIEINVDGLKDFVRESNRIEGILREPLEREVTSHLWFLTLNHLDVAHLVELVRTLARASIRDQYGMDVRVGSHRPPPGGPDIPGRVQALLEDMGVGAYETHKRYETLHPFMDGNGRSGRALWLWMMLRGGDSYVLRRGFLHTWYYQSLQATR